MKTKELWRWRIRWAGKWCTTRHSCTEEAILKQHPEAVRVSGTLKLQEVPETAEEFRERVRADTFSPVQRKLESQ